MVAAAQSGNDGRLGSSANVIGREIWDGGRVRHLFRDGEGVQRYRIPWIEQSGRAAIKYQLHPERSAGEGHGALQSHWMASFKLIRIPQSHGTSPAAKCRKSMRKKQLFHQPNFDARQFPTRPPRRSVFFFINRHSQRSGALPQILPRILVD